VSFSWLSRFFSLIAAATVSGFFGLNLSSDGVQLVLL